MAILAVVGESDCLQFDPPGDKLVRQQGRLGADPYVTSTSGVTTYKPFVDYNYSRCGFIPFGHRTLAAAASSVWMHFLWFPEGGGGSSGIGITLRRGAADIVRFARDNPANRWFIQTLVGGSWVNRGAGVSVSADTFAHTWDIRIDIGGSATIYKDGVKVDEFLGGYTATFPACDDVAFNITPIGAISEFIIANENTIGMRLLTIAPVDYGGAISHFYQMDKASIPNQFNNGSISSTQTFYNTGFLVAGEVDRFISFDAQNHPEFKVNYVANPIDQLDGTHQILAMITNVNASDTGTTPIADVHAFLTDGQADFFESGNLNVGHDGVARSLQTVFNANPITGLSWIPDDVNRLQVGVRTV